MGAQGMIVSYGVDPSAIEDYKKHQQFRRLNKKQQNRSKEFASAILDFLPLLQVEDDICISIEKFVENQWK
jgi:hypothetical protein